MSGIHQILSALQEFEISKSRAVECLEALAAGRFDGSMLPEIQANFGLDEIPMETIQSLRSELASTKLQLEEAEISWVPYKPGVEAQLAKSAKPRGDGTLADQVFWLALDNGSVASGIYEWQQGWSSEGFNTVSMGRIAAQRVHHIALHVTPVHPAKRSSNRAAIDSSLQP
ncbi:hypothetical protein [Hydrogenophaga sp. 2FB]|uniref:hypothetical protein n=1 Tax=Hydrogenophaga sp. 2FB TaxID=2502187 RepID=UPI0010F71F59|nr:hypothetical protein [Hydrogenophaga sp. 2FB]